MNEKQKWGRKGHQIGGRPVEIANALAVLQSGHPGATKKVVFGSSPVAVALDDLVQAIVLRATQPCHIRFRSPNNTGDATVDDFRLENGNYPVTLPATTLTGISVLQLSGGSSGILYVLEMVGADDVI